MKASSIAGGSSHPNQERARSVAPGDSASVVRPAPSLIGGKSRSNTAPSLMAPPRGGPKAAPSLLGGRPAMHRSGTAPSLMGGAKAASRVSAAPSLLNGRSIAPSLAGGRSGEDYNLQSNTLQKAMMASAETLGISLADFSHDDKQNMLRELVQTARTSPADLSPENRRIVELIEPDVLPRASRALAPIPESGGSVQEIDREFPPPTGRAAPSVTVDNRYPMSLSGGRRQGSIAARQPSYVGDTAGSGSERSGWPDALQGSDALNHANDRLRGSGNVAVAVTQSRWTYDPNTGEMVGNHVHIVSGPERLRQNLKNCNAYDHRKSYR